MSLVAVGLDPTPITAWLLLFVAFFSVVSSFLVTARWVNNKIDARQANAEAARDAKVDAKDRAIELRLEQGQRALEAKLLAAVDDRTQSIQPGYLNDGSSLTDLSHQNVVLIEGQATLIDGLKRVNARIDEHLIDGHPELREAD